MATRYWSRLFRSFGIIFDGLVVLALVLGPLPLSAAFGPVTTPPVRARATPS